jgi:hypothetical protein
VRASACADALACLRALVRAGAEQAEPQRPRPSRPRDPSSRVSRSRTRLAFRAPPIRLPCPPRIVLGFVVGAFLPWASGPTEINSRAALLNAYSRLVSQNEPMEDELCNIDDDKCMEDSIALEVKKAELSAVAGYGAKGSKSGNPNKSTKK